MQTHFNIQLRGAVLAAALSAACVSSALAQAAPAKGVTVEPVPVAPAFSQWIESVVGPAPAAAPATGVVVVGGPSVAATATAYQSWPVILGVPDLPLLRGAAPAAGWGEGYNYQGMHVRLVVLDRAGRTVEIRSMSALPKPGERFRIQVTTTFAAAAEVDLVRGTAWESQRVGQVYPRTGMSVDMQAGKTTELPLEPNQFFVMGRADERLLLSVRHPRATERARTQQPAYRQDGRASSSYLQLVPEGRFAAFEQLIATAR